MKNRTELHEFLCDILGSRNVYYQPPESVKMKYPAIVYSISTIANVNADNWVYLSNHKYTITVIDKNPDNPAMIKLSNMVNFKFDRHYTKENLNHDVFTTYI